MSESVVAPARPPTPKGALPAGVSLTKVWRETPDGPLVKHDHDRPVDDTTDTPVGVWWLCPADPDCKVGEWVFPRADGEPARPKKQGCPDHVVRLLPGRAQAADADPKQAARSWLQQRLSEKTTAARKAAADATNARITAIRQAGAAEAARLRTDLREHVPSAVVSAAALVADYTLLEQLKPLQTYALGTGLAVGGAVLAYLTVYVGELVYARRMGYTLAELPRAMRARARGHARWVASGVLATGVWLIIAETVGADLANFRGFLMTMFAVVLIGVVNYRPWAAMVARRRDEARTRIAAAEVAACAEEQRSADLRAERQRRKDAAEQARAEGEAAALAEARKIVTAEDDRLTAGRKFAERWQVIAEDAKARANGPGFEIWRTGVVVEQTRKLTVKELDQDVVIGWEFLIKADPGVLTPRTGNVSPFVMMKKWLASMLEVDVAMVELQYQPSKTPDGADKPTPMINHGLVMLSEAFPLGKAVAHPGADGCYIDDKGVRWGFAGKDLRGRPVHRRQYTAGQAGGGNRVGVTGSGKSIVTQVTMYNDLLLGILPMLHDAGKNAMDFVDFYGIVPVGHTTEHRDIIREALWAEMKRRQVWINNRTAKGLGGMEVIADPKWDSEAGGPPIRAVWEEFHMHMKDPKFVAMLGEMIRLQRATAIMAETATQGSGLADMGDNNLREQLNEVCSQMMRVTDHTARMAGYTGAHKPSDLPNLPGMMVMQEMRGDSVAYRSAFIPRDPQNPNSLIYRLRRPNGTPEGEQILFAPELPPATIEVFTEHGLMDLWELGKTKSGRERLQSEADPVQSTEFPPGLTGILAQVATPVSKPRMRAEDVLVALLKHESDAGRPGLTQQEMLNSPWWKAVDGDWSKNATGVPAHTTIGRACNRLSVVTEQQANAGAAPLIGNDGGTPSRWSLMAAGLERGEQMLMLMRSAGILGPQARAQTQASGVDVAAMERQAMMEAEQAALIQELIREASAGAGR